MTENRSALRRTRKLTVIAQDPSFKNDNNIVTARIDVPDEELWLGPDTKVALEAVKRNQMKASDRLFALNSTLAGVYGDSENTEVPSPKLVCELNKYTEAITTNKSDNLMTSTAIFTPLQDQERPSVILRIHDS